MSSWSTEQLEVSLIGDKKEITEMINVIMKNKGIFNFLTIEDTFDKMIEVIKGTAFYLQNHTDHKNSLHKALLHFLYVDIRALCRLSVL